MCYGSTKGASLVEKAVSIGVTRLLGEDGGEEEGKETEGRVKE